MKVCIKITSHEPTNPIGMALKAIAKLNPVVQIVDTPEEAEFVVVNESTAALDILKDDENVKVLVAIAPGSWGERERAGVPGLTKAYPGRVFARPELESEGEQNIVFFLINLKEELK
jgi:hypothetical protein